MRDLLAGIRVGDVKLKRHTRANSAEKGKKMKNKAKLDAKLESLARDYVNACIDAGMTTADMRDERANVERMIGDFMTRDIRLFAETGKYPQYA